ncbi:MAG: 50S ribosomal protein L6 [Alphaproteobacteria bacterium]|nr:50S ribosomal protein L6 [Alphaproteobacteria bacterium]
MSRIGKYPIEIPSGVTVAVTAGMVSVKGKLGTLERSFTHDVAITVEGNQLVVMPPSKIKKEQTKMARSMWGTARAILQNMVVGVNTGFTKKLEINGVGYKAAVQGKKVVLNLGYSHEVVYEIPEGISIAAERPTLLVISGADKQRVGQVAAEIRAWRGPEPYKGKGIKYETETILRKEGKKK